MVGQHAPSQPLGPQQIVPPVTKRAGPQWRELHQHVLPALQHRQKLGLLSASRQAGGQRACNVLRQTVEFCGQAGIGRRQPRHHPRARGLTHRDGARGIVQMRR